MYSFDISLNRILPIEEDEIGRNPSKIYLPEEIDIYKYKTIMASDYNNLEEDHPIKKNSKRIFMQMGKIQGVCAIVYLYKCERIIIQSDIDRTSLSECFENYEELENSTYLNDFNSIRRLVLKGVLSKDFLYEWQDEMFLFINMIINL